MQRPALTALFALALSAAPGPVPAADGVPLDEAEKAETQPLDAADSAST